MSEVPTGAPDPWRAGARVVVRHRLPEGSSPSLTDVIGVVSGHFADPVASVVLDTTHGLVTVALADVVAVREVPPRQARPGPAHTSIRVGSLERVMAQAWPAIEVEQLGDWLLRASSGFTGRGNSVLADGDPMEPLAEAVDACERWYAARGLPARFHLDLPEGDPGDLASDVTKPSEAAASLPLGVELLRRGYDAVQPTCTMTGPVSAVAPPRDPSAVHVDTHLTPQWLATYARQRALVPGVSERILTGSPEQLFLSTGPPGDLTGVARVSFSPGWAGVHALWVDPAVRRSGLATALMATAAALARQRRILSLVLQVEAGNQLATTLYERLGMATHHVYVYLDQPK